jgi:broad specificity phosphatase PhoE
LKELYFIRHGQTEWNAIRRMQGQWNSNLTELGRDQADINGKLLSSLGIDYLVASPLDRTRQTADIINQHLELEINYDDRIMEWHCGDWSGEMWDDVSKKWPEEFASWQEDQFNYRGPNCENYPDMFERTKPFLDEVLALNHKRTAVVSHGVIARAMVSSLLKHSTSEVFRYGQANDTIFHLTEDKESFSVQHFIRGDGPFGGLPPRNY